MVVDNLKFGWATHVKPLVEHLRRNGVQTDLFSGHGNSVRTCWLVKKKACEKRYNLLHVQGSPFAGFVIQKKVPIITTVHTTLWREQQFQQNISSVIGLFLEHRSFNVTDQIIAVNKILVPELANHYHIPTSKIVSIPNGVDTSEFDSYPKIERAMFVFSCGRNIMRKGFGILKEACKKVNVPLGLAHGNLSRSQLILAYKKAIMFVCPSYYETGPITVMEAMAAKCPVICSDIESVDGLVVPFETGLLFHRGDSADLAQKIQMLLENEKLRSLLAMNAYAHVKQHYNWHEAAEKTVQVYEEVMTGEGSRC